MKTEKQRVVGAAWLVLAVPLAIAAGQSTRQPSDGENLASGKPCAFDPAPNYSYCRDEDDPKQLTDGEYNGCVWTDKGTVGWQVGRNRVSLVDIDLGAAHPIGKVTFDSITGGAQVTFPSGVLVFVSNDGKQYRLLCDVFTECPPQTRSLNHRFVADGLKGWGRHVRLALLAGGFFMFCDEVEIIKGTHGPEDVRYLDDQAIPAEEVKQYAERMLPWAAQKNATITLLREADEAAVARARRLGNAVATEETRKQIQKERAAVLAERSVAPADCTQGPPYRQWDRRAFQAVARLNANLWPDGPVVVWQKNDWDWLRPLEGPIAGKPTARVLVNMMNNEWATASFVVTSCSDKPLELDLAADDFRGPSKVTGGELLRIAHVVHAEAFGYSYRDDAIVPLAEGPVILQPGTSKRIWLTFKTRGMDLKPGTYTSSIHIVAGSDDIASVPIQLRVWPLRFPDEVTLHSNSWGYFDDPCLAGREELAAQDLLDHYNTSLVLNHRYLPKPKPDRDGNLTEPLDFTKLDQMLEWNPQCRLWLIWVGFEFGFNRMGTPGFGTPAWENAFTQYVTQVRDHLAEKGVSRKQFAWYWSDEPGGERWEKYDHPASRLLKKIDPEMLVWADPNSSVSARQLEASLPFVDTYCPSVGTLNSKAVLDVCHRTKQKSWQYVCASEKNQNPFAYYRWMSWKAWKNGLGGIGMWVYVDLNAQTFSDYTSGVSYAMIYKGEKGVIGSKRWDAWRQGIADYEYLQMLTDAVAAARKAGIKEDVREKAERLLTDGVDEVVGDSPHSGDRTKREAPDRLRVEILELLNELQR